MLISTAAGFTERTRNNSDANVIFAYTVCYTNPSRRVNGLFGFLDYQELDNSSLFIVDYAS